MTFLHVVDKVVERWACLIRHAPAGIKELKAAILDDLADLIFHVIALLVPPHGEELHLDLGEMLGLVTDQLPHHVINDQFDIRPLNIVLGPREVLIDCL
jgi:hypothetical protein